jgi:recombination protein RecR
MTQPDPLGRLIGLLSRLPGIGEKTATRLAFHLLSAPKEFVSALAGSLSEVSEKIVLCSVCCTYTEADPCAYCTDRRRDEESVCVVSRVQDMMAIERTGTYRGRYHVLHGVLNPLEGIGPDDLKVPELIRRLEDGKFSEVILALSPNVEGETTAVYLASLFRPLDIRITKIAAGVPIGGELEYTDGVTLGRALDDRREL